MSGVTLVGQAAEVEGNDCNFANPERGGVGMEVVVYVTGDVVNARYPDRIFPPFGERFSPSTAT